MEPNWFPLGAPASNNPSVQGPFSFTGNAQWPTSQGATSPTGPPMQNVTIPDDHFPDPRRDRWQTDSGQGASPIPTGPLAFRNVTPGDNHSPDPGNRWPGQTGGVRSGNSETSSTGPFRNVTTPDHHSPDPGKRWQTGVRSGSETTGSQGPFRNVTTPENHFPDPRGAGHSNAGNQAPPLFDIQSLINLQPQSTFPQELRLYFFLLGHGQTSSWVKFTHNAMARVSFVMLTGVIPPSLTLPPNEAKSITDGLLQWHRMIREDPGWKPAEVTGVDSETCTAFRTSLEDSTFTRLLGEHLDLVPMSFFKHVRASVKRLLTPAYLQADPHHREYPQQQIPGFLREAESHVNWVRRMLKWDDRYGFELWHVVIQEATGLQIWWFANRALREFVWHALRQNNSVGSFAVFDYDGVSSPPCTVQTVSFVLAALTVELEEVAKYKAFKGITEYVARFQVVHKDVLQVLTSLNERSNGHMTEQENEIAFQGLQSFLQFAHIDDIKPVAGAVSTTFSIT